VRLEGTLDAFSLPDIFQLLSFTKKTGTLHLRRADSGAERHGVVHLREGAVSGARSDVTRQSLGRRVVGAGLVDDEALEKAAAAVTPENGLAKALLDLGAVDADSLRSLASEHATDSVFDLLRWPDGEFAFVVDEADPDDLGAALPVEDIVTEGRRRLETWPALTEAVPSADAVVSVVPAPAGDPVLDREEWALMALVDGRRTVADLVVLTGRGEYAVFSALAGLVSRGLVTLEGGDDALLRRQELLARLEGLPVPTSTAPPARAAAPVVERKPVIPERPEPFTAPRQPDHAEEMPVAARPVGATASVSASVPAPSAPAAVVQTVGSTALAAEPAPSGLIERDPSVNKSLLLRLIAGVRGL
jgi:hypothetical protein